MGRDWDLDLGVVVVMGEGGGEMISSRLESVDSKMGWLYDKDIFFESL